MRNEQEAMKQLGKSGCLVMCLAKAYEISPVDLYFQALKGGAITADCYVTSHPLMAKAVSALAPSTCVFEGVFAEPPREQGLVYIAEYVLGGKQHFVLLAEPKGEVLYDPSGDSITRAKGWLKTYRIYRRKK